jgi:signal transduction histidine kinase
VTVSLTAALAWRARIRDEGARAFQVEAGNVGSAVTTDMRRIDDITVAVRALIAINPQLTNRSLGRWYAGINAGGRYQGLLGFTYVRYVPSRRLAPFVAALRADPVPGLALPPGPLRIYPAGPRRGYCLLRASASRQRTLSREISGPGLDVCAIPGGQVFASTRDSGQLSTVMLTEKPGLRVLVVTTPIYRGGLMPASIAARRAELVGWALGQFDIGSVLGGALSDERGVRISLYRRDLVYARSVATVVGPVSAVASAGTLHGGSPLRRTFTIDADGRWIVTVAEASEWGLLTPDTQAIVVLALGLLIGALGFWLRRAQQQAERANLAKSVFLSRMGHELRTPLNSILGFAQLLETDCVSDRQRKWVQDILRSGRHLLELINEVLDIAHIETGRLAVTRQAVAVGPALEEAVAMVGPQASERRIDVRLERAGCELCVYADPKRMRQVLLNLIVNAIKYNRDDGVVTVACQPAGASALAILIRDTGIGIPAARLGDVFTPFERLAAKDSEVEGTGLGLALSRGLMELMGGTLRVESKTGIGSTFAVEFPLADSTQPGAILENGVATLR